MMKLLHVKRTRPLGFFLEGARREPQAFIPSGKIDTERDVYEKICEFFLIDERELETTLRLLAQANPGMDVEVYGLEQVGHCPAGEFVAKKVTKDGVLPA